MNYCKLTNQNLQTHNDYQWVIGEWKETSGNGELCTDGWLHCYTHPLLAVFFNSIHADFKNPKLFEIEVAGETLTDYGIKVGFTKMRLVKEIPLPQVTDTQRVAFGILCVKEVVTDEKWLNWADNWLNGTDRTKKTAKSIQQIAVLRTGAYDAVSAVANNYSSAASCAAAYAVYDAKHFVNLIELAKQAITNF